MAGYWKLEHDGGGSVSPNARVVVRLLSADIIPFKGFILKTSAGTLAVKDATNTQAVSASACDGAIGHNGAIGKYEVEAYLDLPSTTGTVTVTAEVVQSKMSVALLTLDIEVVEAWTQVGDDIDGSGAFKLGYSVSMNTDGTRMAVGAPGKPCADNECSGGAPTNGDPNAGYVHVFQYDETASPVWQKMGTGIPGLNGLTDSEQRGHMVSISGDGTRVASIGKYESGTAERQRLKVHQWNSESQSWTDMPGLYIGHEPPFYAAAMSRDGERVSAVVYGYPGYDLLVFEVDSGGTWSQVGSKMNFAREGMFETSYGAVAMSADGNRFVVGFPAGTNYGMMRVYELASDGSTWGQTGGDIDGEFTSSPGKGYLGKFGRSVAISADGSRVVAGATGYMAPSVDMYGAEPYVRVYEWNAGSWQQLGSDVTMGQQSPVNYHFGYSVDMSDDGSRIAVRALIYGELDSGKSLTLLYSFDSATNDWLKTAEIEDEAGGDSYDILYNYETNIPTNGIGSITQVSLSGDGKYVAIGAHLNNGGGTDAGHVRVYKDPSVAAPSPASPSGSCSSSSGTGGTVTTAGEYTIHTFTSSGTFTVADSTLTAVDVLIVGGGGAGGMDSGGGGGGGAVLYSASKTLSSSSITVTVGNGGVYSASDGDGGASAFDGMVANGGKGGKSSYENSGKHGGVSGSGNAGGSGVSYLAAGGGGGAGGPGEAGQQQSEILAFDKGGDGGPGVESAISGTSNYYGGGGGGGVYNFSGRPGSAGNGGLGGGAPGGQVFGSPASSGSAFTGGGGGGSPMMTNDGAGPGGSGVVIVRYTSATCSCGTDYYHDGSDCVACPTGSTRMPDTDNECLCPANYHRKLDGGVYSCAACAQGATRPAGDTVPGGTATTCAVSAPSAQDTKKQAETTRDSILDDISDARVKAKAKLLADAAIAGVKVQRLSAKLTAADEDTACSETFSKAGMSAGDGACVATAASSGKRRSLSAMAYDVELMFSASTVNDDALKAAELELKNNGVEGVTSQTSVDPIAELKTVPGMDMGKLQTFETEASAAATATASEAQTPPPPTPPPPPKPNLVLDDDDGTVGLVGKAGLLMATAFAILAM
jgi:hypothetical protein